MSSTKHTKIYAENLDNAAFEQFESAMSQDFAVKGALMPDAHKGYSLPIGAVVATKGFIVPSWVGYDIGCGMCALKLEGIKKQYLNGHKDYIFKRIYDSIPVGFNTNSEDNLAPIFAKTILGLTLQGLKIAQVKKYRNALGSLGGGNHFIEIGYDENDAIWIVIHSGSRGVGHSIATHYMTIASSDTTILEEEFDATHKEMLKHNPSQYEAHKAKYVKKKTGRLRPKEGHYALDVNSQEGKDYIKDLNWCLDYALANRKEMMRRVVDVITEALDISCYEIDFSELINRNHNHAVERDGLWIHRKGATHAEKDMMGVIPGNMKDGSFIVKGKGNPESLYSSSHGAGRVLSRRQANEKLSLEDFESSMEGITALVGQSTLDESPLAYKDIHEVMRLQRDLVEVVAHITPLINIKG